MFRNVRAADITSFSLFNTMENTSCTSEALRAILCVCFTKLVAENDERFQQSQRSLDSQSQTCSEHGVVSFQESGTSHKLGKRPRDTPSDPNVLVMSEDVRGGDDAEKPPVPLLPL